MKQAISFLIAIILFLISPSAFGQTINNNDYLLSIDDSIHNEYGYVNQKGDTVIPMGKYSIFFTDTFRTYAIVLKSNHGYIAIDRKENFLFEVFPFDNGPDYTSEGYFRIIANGKIGFVDSATGKIIISPQFDCAFPFNNGIAKVSNNCTLKFDGEHSTWISSDWFYIDKSGHKVNPPMNSEK